MGNFTLEYAIETIYNRELETRIKDKLKEHIIYKNYPNKKGISTELIRLDESMNIEKLYKKVIKLLDLVKDDVILKLRKENKILKGKNTELDKNTESESEESESEESEEELPKKIEDLKESEEEEEELSKEKRIELFQTRRRYNRKVENPVGCIYKCSCCNHTSYYKKSITLHIDTAKNNKNPKFSKCKNAIIIEEICDIICEICSVRYMQRSSLVRHLRETKCGKLHKPLLV